MSMDLKPSAHAAVAQAVQTGRLVRPERCSRCGNDGPIEGHHADYTKPLDVEWLCKRCHGKAHAKPVPPGVVFVTCSVRVEYDLQTRYIQAIVADDPRAKVGPSLRRHMLEVAEAHEERAAGRVAA